MTVPTVEPAAMTNKKLRLRPMTAKLWSWLYQVNATSIVGRLTARETVFLGCHGTARTVRPDTT
ncbi:hypothetical protein [Pararhizobium sp. PWRC1-1]|uniref:hypothetical protein n=1 Tax=Pararhizobium sp. PWRC1-1 TaxID=2804566 RepID=UPI003CF2BDD8